MCVLKTSYSLALFLFLFLSLFLVLSCVVEEKKSGHWFPSWRVNWAQECNNTQGKWSHTQSVSCVLSNYTPYQRKECNSRCTRTEKRYKPTSHKPIFHKDFLFTSLTLATAWLYLHHHRHYHLESSFFPNVSLSLTLASCLIFFLFFLFSSASLSFSCSFFLFVPSFLFFVSCPSVSLQRQTQGKERRNNWNQGWTG